MVWQMARLWQKKKLSSTLLGVGWPVRADRFSWYVTHGARRSCFQRLDVVSAEYGDSRTYMRSSESREDSASLPVDLGFGELVSVLEDMSVVEPRVGGLNDLSVPGPEV
jgi:hypothetical protein